MKEKVPEAFTSAQHDEQVYLMERWAQALENISASHPCFDGNNRSLVAELLAPRVCLSGPLRLDRRAAAVQQKRRRTITRPRQLENIIAAGLLLSQLTIP